MATGQQPLRSRRLTLAVVLGVCAVMSGAAPGASQNPAPAVGMIAVEGEGAHFWPRWRGPSGQGLVDGSGYTDRWSATENVIWRTTVPGQGNSSPIVWADRIFLTTGRDGGNRLFVLAYRRSDGSLLWETEVAPGPRERVHRKNGPASATPVTDGERVYASLGGRGLVALDSTGACCGTRRLARSTTTTARPARRCSTATGSSSTRTRTTARSSPRTTPQPAPRSGARRATPASAGAHRWRFGSATMTS